MDIVEKVDRVLGVLITWRGAGRRTERGTERGGRGGRKEGKADEEFGGDGAVCCLRFGDSSIGVCTCPKSSNRTFNAAALPIVLRNLFSFCFVLPVWGVGPRPVWGVGPRTIGRLSQPSCRGAWRQRRELMRGAEWRRGAHPRLGHAALHVRGVGDVTGSRGEGCRAVLLT